MTGTRPRAALPLSLLALTASLAGSACAAPWEEAFGNGFKKQPPGQGETAARPPTPARPPAPASAALPDRTAAQALADAESLVATFNAAHEAGATAFGRMRTKQQVVAALAAGVPGGGRYADTLFRVPGLDPTRRAAAEQHIAIERGRIVVRRQSAGPAPAAAAPADPRTPFAGGKLLIEVPRGFVATTADNGDLVLTAGGATLTLHLEASTGGLDAWKEIRDAGERSELQVRMSGKKAYLIDPDRSAPERVVVGFGQTLVSMAIDASAPGAELTPIRMALPNLIRSLGVVAD